MILVPPCTKNGFLLLSPLKSPPTKQNRQRKCRASSSFWSHRHSTHQIDNMRKEVVAAAALTAAAAITAIAALVRHRKRRKEQQWKETQKILRKFARDCATPVPKLWQVANAFVADMRSSLIASNGTNTSLNMLVSYVASLPSGYLIRMISLDLLETC